MTKGPIDNTRKQEQQYQTAAVVMIIKVIIVTMIKTKFGYGVAIDDEIDNDNFVLLI